MEKSALHKLQSDRLIFLGVLLFLLGLIVGLLAPLFANSRMGVSSHIEGVLNGIFLMVLGLIWHKVALSERWLKITFWLSLYGTFANWFGILVAAIFNAGKMLGILANGQEGPAFAEGIVTFSLISLSLAMLVVLCNGTHRVEPKYETGKSGLVTKGRHANYRLAWVFECCL